MNGSVDSFQEVFIVLTIHGRDHGVQSMITTVFNEEISNLFDITVAKKNTEKYLKGEKVERSQKRF